MIRYRQSDALKVIRSDAPEPPFWAASTIAPYSFPRSAPLALDHVRLLGTAVDRAEVMICRSPANSLAKSEISAGPVLIDSTETAELVYRRAEECHLILLARGELGIIQLISTLGAVPRVSASPRSLVVVSAWPLHLRDLERMMGELSQAGLRWGLAIPILFPPTTDLGTLERLANLAGTNGAEFLVGLRFDLDPHARRSLAMSFPADDETYSTLSDQGEEAISIATERHIAALAFERSLEDAIFPFDRNDASNWSAAVPIALAGHRLIQMREDVELGWELVRSAGRIAMLPKPLTRIAAAASLSIIEGLPTQLTDALEEWLSRGTARLFDQIDSRWRLRRDYRR